MAAVPPVRSICAAALIAVLLALPAPAFAQGEPIVEPLPGEPMIEPLLENGQPVDSELPAEPADEIHPIEDDAPIAGTASIESLAAVDPNASIEPPLAAAAPPGDGEAEKSILVKVEAKQAEPMGRIVWVLSLVALGGLLMLLATLLLRGRYPGRQKVSAPPASKVSATLPLPAPPRPPARHPASPPIPTAEPRRRVARGTTGQPSITPSQLNTAPPPLPLSATDPNLGMTPYGDGRKR
jgi:hypothetical protein